MLWQMILFQVVTFVVILAVLHLVFGTQLKIAMRRLQILHQESLEKEEILNKEIERARTQSQSEIARSKEEARRIIEEAKSSAEKMTTDVSDRAQIEAKKILADAAENAKRREAEILASVEQKAIRIATKLIQYTFSPKNQKSLHTQLIDELIEEFRKIDKNRIAVRTNSAEIITSVALTDKEKQELKQILREKLGRDLEIVEKVDESLIMGLVIQLGGLLVDGSLQNKLSRAAAALHVK